MSSAVMLASILRLGEEDPLQDLPGLRQIVLLVEIDQLVVLEHLVEGVEQGRRDLVAHRQGLEPGQAGVFQLVDAPLAVAVDQDVLVLVDDPLIVGVLVHHIDADPLLLVAVDPPALGPGLQRLELLVGDRFVGEIELLESVVVSLVLLVDQLDQVEGAAMAEQAVDFIDQFRVVADADVDRPLERLAEEAGDVLLLLAQRPGHRPGQEEKAVVKGIPLEEDPLVAVVPLGLAGELKLILVLVEGPVKHQPVAHLGLGQVGQRQVDAEHVLAEHPAVATVADLLAAEHELVAGRKEAQTVAGRLEEIAGIGIARRHHGKVFDGVVEVAVQPDFLVHSPSPHGRDRSVRQRQRCCQPIVGEFDARGKPCRMPPIIHLVAEVGEQRAAGADAAGHGDGVGHMCNAKRAP